MSVAINHYGVMVESEVPITGVISNNVIGELVFDELISDSINLSFEAVSEADQENWEDDPSDILLIGFKKRGDGKYEPDIEANISIIVNEFDSQIVKSHYVKRCGLCSPCFPGQGDLESKGDFLAFCISSVDAEYLCWKYDGEIFRWKDEICRIKD